MRGSRRVALAKEEEATKGHFALPRKATREEAGGVNPSA